MATTPFPFTACFLYFLLLFYWRVVTIILGGDVAGEAINALSCPNPTTDETFDGKCYAFYQSNDVRNYDDAAAYCVARQMRLSAPQSEEELLFLANAIEAEGWTRALIGLRFTQTSWRWSVDGSLLRGQGCNLQISIEDSALQGDGTYSEALTPLKCIDFCSSESASFAAVMGGSMCYCASRFVWKAPASSCSLPCSGSLEEVCGSTLNSLVFSTQSDTYDNWMLGHPTVAGSCATLKVDHSTNHWLETSCNLALPFICRFGNAGSSKNAVLQSAGVVLAKTCQDGACFYLFSTPELVWSDAEAFCAKYGGNLAKIDSSDRQSQINQMLSDSLSSFTLSQVWIGATNRFWIYESDQSTMMQTSSSFRGWVNVIEPVSPESNQCAVMTLQDDGTYGWKTKMCTTMADTKNRFVCESWLSNVPRTTTKRLTTPDEFDLTTPNSPVSSKTAVRGEVTVPSEQQSKTSTSRTTTLPETTAQGMASTQKSAAGATTNKPGVSTGNPSTAKAVTTSRPASTTAFHPTTSIKLVSGVTVIVTDSPQTPHPPTYQASTPQPSSSSDSAMTTTSLNAVPPEAVVAQTPQAIVDYQTTSASNNNGGNQGSGTPSAPPYGNSQGGNGGDNNHHGGSSGTGDNHGGSNNGQGADNHGDGGGSYNGQNNGDGTSGTHNNAGGTTSHLNNGLAWWVILLITLGCLAVVGAAIGLSIYLLKRCQANARVAHRDVETAKQEPDSGSESEAALDNQKGREDGQNTT